MFKCWKRRKARNCCVCIVGKRPSYLFQFNSKSQYFSSPSKRATYKPIISLWTFLPYLFSVPRVSFAFVPSFLCFFIVSFPTHRNNIHLNIMTILLTFLFCFLLMVIQLWECLFMNILLGLIFTLVLSNFS